MLYGGSRELRRSLITPCLDRGAGPGSDDTFTASSCSSLRNHWTRDRTFFQSVNDPTRVLGMTPCKGKKDVIWAMQVASTEYLPMLSGHGNIADPEWLNSLSDGLLDGHWLIRYIIKLE